MGSNYLALCSLLFEILNFYILQEAEYHRIKDEARNQFQYIALKRCVYIRTSRIDYCDYKCTSERQRGI